MGQGVKLVGQTGEALRRIVNEVAEIDALVAEIAASSHEQATGLAQVNTAVNQMDQVTQQNAAMVEEATAASASLASEADRLRQLIHRFQLGHGGVLAGRVVNLAAAPATTAARPTPSAARRMMNKVASAFGGGAAANGDNWTEF